MKDRPPTEPHADFIDVALNDILTSTFNSKPLIDAWLQLRHDALDNALYRFSIEPDIDHPVSVQPHVQATPKPGHPI